MIRILQVTKQNELRNLMAQMHVDPYGIRIMAPKAEGYIIKIDSLSNTVVQILKQEMLSIGGDVALPRNVILGKAKKTSCLLIATYAQLIKLCAKLAKQPFGLAAVSNDLHAVIRQYNSTQLHVKTRDYSLDLSKKTLIMGILNLTSDSFSQDGIYQQGYISLSTIIQRVETMIRDGADIIDIGAESSRPGARPISQDQELKRLIPVIKALRNKIGIPLSIDTYKPLVAKQALDNGASIINDISGLRNSQMIKVISRMHAGVIIMHMKGTPRIMQRNPLHDSAIDVILRDLNCSLVSALQGGITKQQILIDPGICFGKTYKANVCILKNIRELCVLGCPIVLGISRKSFIGHILHQDVYNRMFGSIAGCVLAASHGVKILRVHDVKATADALKFTDIILRYKNRF